MIACGPELEATIYGGGVRPVHNLNGAEAAVVGLYIASSESFCSAVLIDEGRALTARHCIVPDAEPEGSRWREKPEATLLFGPDLRDPLAMAEVLEATLHETLDLAIVRFEPPGDAELPLAALAVDALGPEWLGTAAEIVGYGRTEDDGIAERRFVVEEVVGYDQTFVTVDGRGKTGGCAGDSGGPLFARSNDGSVRVIGILYGGEANCLGVDYFSRVDTAREWLAVGADAAPADACFGLDSTGICLRGQSLWCEDGVRRAAHCETPEVCGWSDERAGFRCVAQEQDPCAGLGSSRHCEGNEVVSCNDGTIVHDSCERCQTDCVAWRDERGAACGERAEP